MGRRSRSTSSLNNNKQTSTSNNSLYNPLYNTNWSAATRSRCCADFSTDITRQRSQVTKLNRDISDIQLRVDDHEHAVERA